MRRTAKRPTLALVQGNPMAPRRPQSPTGPIVNGEWPVWEKHLREYPGFGTEMLDLMIYNADPSDTDDANPVLCVQLHRIDETEAFTNDLLDLVRKHLQHRVLRSRTKRPLTLAH